ncbi:hypothetical protein [Cohaesibacter intestini]|uniref:hypothetical protein n=1 Tax=Cohaesibacter intestini TaxID=2211145 RepID=UPI000DE851B8|nr:hypothetical protein [Cohaesibacter intestini]
MNFKRGFEAQISADAVKQAASALALQILIKARGRVAAVDPIRTIQKTGLQLGLYCLLVAGSLGVVVNGSKLIVDQIHAKMFEMGYEVAKQNLPKKIQTASIRSSVE